jgi:hypothetical protein
MVYNLHVEFSTIAVPPALERLLRERLLAGFNGESHRDLKAPCGTGSTMASMPQT